MAHQGCVLCVLLGCASAGIWFVAEKLLKVVYWFKRGCLLDSIGLYLLVPNLDVTFYSEDFLLVGSCMNT